MKTCKDLCEAYGLRQAILVGWDGTSVHVVTYGTNTVECDQAAQGGNVVKKALGWPEELCSAEPPRVKKLKDEIKAQKIVIDHLRKELGDTHGSLAMLRLAIDEACR